MLSLFKKKSGPPNATAVVKRVLILKHLFVKGLASPPPEYLPEWKSKWTEKDWNKLVAEMRSQSALHIQRLRESGLWNDVEQNERDFIQLDPMEMTNQARIDAIWLAESIVCLLWALGYISELPPYDQQADSETPNKLPKEPVQDLIEKASLRPADLIQKQRGRAETWHCPLSINPAPTQIARVFVGRLELVTPATEKAVEAAFTAHDKAALEKYGRFLEPILQTMMAKDSNRLRSARYAQYLSVVEGALVTQARSQK